MADLERLCPACFRLSPAEAAVCPVCGADLAAMSAREAADRRLLGPERATANA